MLEKLLNDIIRQPKGAKLYKDKRSFVIGGMEGVRYREYEIHLEV